MHTHTDTYTHAWTLMHMHTHTPLVSAQETALPHALFSPKIEVPGDEGNQYSFLSPEPRHGHAVRMRTADVRLLQWGDWGMPVAFGTCPQNPATCMLRPECVPGPCECVSLTLSINRACPTRGCMWPRTALNVAQCKSVNVLNT